MPRTPSRALGVVINRHGGARQASIRPIQPAFYGFKAIQSQLVKPLCVGTEPADDARDRRLIRELQLELSKVDLRLLAAGVSKRTSNVGNGAGRIFAQQVGHGGVAPHSRVREAPERAGGRSGPDAPSPVRADTGRMDQSTAGAACAGHRPAPQAHA